MNTVTCKFSAYWLAFAVVWTIMHVWQVTLPMASRSNCANLLSRCGKWRWPLIRASMTDCTAPMDKAFPAGCGGTSGSSELSDALSFGFWVLWLPSDESKIDWTSSTVRVLRKSIRCNRLRPPATVIDNRLGWMTIFIQIRGQHISTTFSSEGLWESKSNALRKRGDTIDTCNLINGSIKLYSLVEMFNLIHKSFSTESQIQQGLPATAMKLGQAVCSHC